MITKNKSSVKTKNYAGLSPQEYTTLVFFSILYTIKKLPFILYNGQINPDESQMLTQAITLKFDPIFWRSVDGTTSGPINSYIILLLKYAGLPFNYLTLHATATGLVIFSLFITYLTLRLFNTIKVSFLSIIIIYSFFFFTNHNDFNHYNSELPSFFLITLAIYILAYTYHNKKIPIYLYILFSIICCLIPFAKLQGGPLAILYLLYEFFIILKRKLNKTAAIVGLGSGMVIVGGSLLAYLFYNNIIYDFYIMYIKTNLNHYNVGDPFSLFIKLIFKSSYDYLFFLIYNIIIWSTFPIVISKKNYSYLIYKDNVFIFLSINIVVSYIVVTRTGYTFEHYLFYTLFPITLLTSHMLSHIFEYRDIKKYTFPIVSIMMTGLFIGLVTVHILKYNRKNQNFKRFELAQHEINVIKLINYYTKPTDCLVVWGWNLTYHTLTGLRQGTRENHSIRCMTTNSLGAIHDPYLIEYYCHQYVNDIKRNRPAVFIDEVKMNSIFKDPNLVAHQTIPDLRNTIMTNYTLIDQQAGVLVYVRKDILKIRGKLNLGLQKYGRNF
ncbi:hypothetical protein [Larkinella humicola]|uniref:Dolichyl-phosphate-mannose-protein mannosyltransferase n=1 Tax=Larkinella humicola TaxID=2607654 RepID=A0A5N1J9N5_9BACT|nr:hypothetical protein [Larkinella humicola]KAA9349372.1 hypothetical protein F0P93_23560 [Larkinella humicola]